MSDLIVHTAENLADLITGPLHMRLVVEPVMASLFAVIDGLQDATARRPAYLWPLLDGPGQRHAQVRDGLSGVGKILAIAVALDFAYQVVAQGVFHLGEALVVALVLAILPYTLLRGPVTRLATRRRPH